jgi:hypothetical protein
MDINWSDRIAEAEGDYLQQEELDAIEQYAASFPHRQLTYQALIQQEHQWIADVLQQYGHHPQGELTRSAILLAEQLARCLRLVGICLLTDDSRMIVQSYSGLMELYLNLPEALQKLMGTMQRSLTSAQLALLQPHWRALVATCSPDGGEDRSNSTAPTDEPSSESITLVEMFV